MYYFSQEICHSFFSYSYLISHLTVTIIVFNHPVTVILHRAAGHEQFNMLSVASFITIDIVFIDINFKMIKGKG